MPIPQTRLRRSRAGSSTSPIEIQEDHLLEGEEDHHPAYQGRRLEAEAAEEVAAEEEAEEGERSHSPAAHRPNRPKSF